MRLVFAIFRLIFILPFSPMVIVVCMLAALDWDDFKGLLVDTYWAY